MKVVTTLNYHIVVLMTCHNRRDKTLACLRSFFSQTRQLETEFTVYLVDDGSWDGTSVAIAREFPQIRILQGNGSLYWAGGMRLAWAEAMKEDYDGYLWLNDDVELLPGAIKMLLKTWFNLQKEAHVNPIVIGACRDPRFGKLVYGGYHRKIEEGILPEADHPQRCYAMNGNIVFVPREVAQVVGNLSSDYTHAMADIDYGLRANEKGFALYVAPGVLGACEPNFDPQWICPAVPFRKRWRNLHSPKGLPPWEYMKLRRRSGFPLWFLVPVKLYLHVCFPALFEKWQRPHICIGQR